jgi:hypothetical protein
MPVMRLKATRIARSLRDVQAIGVHFKNILRPIHFVENDTPRVDV